jgi:hypothetical protein
MNNGEEVQLTSLINITNFQIPSRIKYNFYRESTAKISKVIYFLSHAHSFEKQIKQCQFS